MFNGGSSLAPDRLHRAVQQRILMLPAGPRMYVGLCGADVEPHYLVVGGVLFLFLMNVSTLAEFVQEFEELLQKIPESSGWLRQDVANNIRMDKLAEKFALYNNAAAASTGEMLVRRRRRLIE